VSLIFALTAIGSFGLLYNLLSLSNKKPKSHFLLALSGPAFTLILSNWEGFLHFLHSGGVFWKNSTSSAFWKWLDIQDLVKPPSGDSFGHWWWWRASRVIQDYDFSGAGKEVISEFPFFSFLLADLHPHVLSMPFVFLILVFTLELFIKPRERGFTWLKLLPLKISPNHFMTLAWLAGSMAFLNTWNFPMYVGILAGVYALRYNRETLDWQVGNVLRDIFFLGASLGVTGGLMYLPWYLGFASQAGGIIPNVLYITRGVQYWVMFGPLLIPIFIWLFILWGKRKDSRQIKIGITLSGSIVIGLLILMLAIVFGVIWLPLESRESLINLFLNSVGGSNINQVVAEGFLRRLVVPGTLITLVIISTLALSMLFYRKNAVQMTDGRFSADQFVLILILGGMILTIVPEFVFLRDLFGYRINTIFKFYFQTWLMWSIAAAYGTIKIFQNAKSPIGYFFSIFLTLSLIMGIFYPVMGIQSKTNDFTRPEGMTLDGEYLYPPSESEGAEFLRSASPGVIAEAVGGSYSTAHARMATYSGNPNVLGWDFHEIQWRGDGTLVWPRKEKIATLYCTHSWEIARQIIEEFQIRYVILGDIEYSTYREGSESCPTGLQTEKFNRNLVQVFRNDNLIIFEVPALSIEP
jgi:YYY domain-containing protein